MGWLTPDGEYPAHDGLMRQRHPEYAFADPNTITAEEGAALGWLLPVEVERPAQTEYQHVNEDAPVEVDGVLTQVWVVTDFTAEETSAHDTAKATHTANQEAEVAVEATLDGMDLTEEQRIHIRQQLNLVS